MDLETMNLKRELDKIELALKHAVEYHKKVNEANAILHLSERVMYSPMTTELFNAHLSVLNLIQDIQYHEIDIS